MRLMLLFGFVALATAHSSPDCVVGDWRDWTACRNDDVKVTFEASGAANRERDHSFKATVAGKGEGRLNMEWSRMTKERLGEEKEACRRDGTCPELARKPSEGQHKCVNGSANGWKCWNVDQESFISMADLGYPDPIEGDRWHELSDMWGWTDKATSEEYVIVGISGGYSFVRVTDPVKPVVLGFLPTRTVASIWRDIKVVNDHAYMVSEAADHGMMVFDLRTLNERNDFQRLTPHATYSKVGNVHNIISNEETNTLFIVGAKQDKPEYTNCNSGLHMIDVSDPINPKFAGCFGDDGYVHDAQCVIYRGPDSRYTGKEICFCYNENTFTIVDVTDRANGKMLGRVSYNAVHYTHQGWLTEDQSVAIMDDEQDEQKSGTPNTRTMIWDVTDLTEPTLQNSFWSAETAIDHNQYILGNYTYQSNYQAGLQLLRIDQANYALERVAYYDVYPSETAVKFGGSWSNYPYFKSGAVAMTSMEFGLFMVRPDWAKIEAQLASRKSHSEQVRYRDILSATNPGKCPSLVQTREC